jgi:hypothetical protein
MRDVCNSAQRPGLAEAEALKKGMDEKSKGSVENCLEVYSQA